MRNELAQMALDCAFAVLVMLVAYCTIIGTLAIIW